MCWYSFTALTLRIKYNRTFDSNENYFTVDIFTITPIINMIHSHTHTQKKTKQKNKLRKRPVFHLNTTQNVLL